MKDNVWKEFLEQTEGNLEWESHIKYLKEELALEGDDLWKHIVNSSQTGRDRFDRLLKIK